MGWSKVIKFDEMLIAFPLRVYELYLGIVIGSMPSALPNLMSVLLLSAYADVKRLLPYLIGN
ncbi:MAG: hypothetical protein B6U69_01130 [Thermofilum sp. ex4484_15]|nr:MAG: hypothetical protein B6U69_01130 [Thermofilum sp. ex4484_15]